MRDLQEFWVKLPPTEWNGRHGASLETLADRLRYGGKKGRRAGQRILRREYRVAVARPLAVGTSASVPLFPVSCDCGVELHDLDECVAHECPHTVVASESPPLRPADHDATETRGVKDR